MKEPTRTNHQETLFFFSFETSFMTRGTLSSIQNLHLLIVSGDRESERGSRKRFFNSSMVEQTAVNRQVAGSIPA